MEKMFVGLKLEHYVVIYTPRNPDWGWRYDGFSEVVEDRDPLKIDSDCICFRFYDKICIILSNGDILRYKNVNYSPKYYSGKRLSKEEMDETLNQFPFLKDCQNMIQGNGGLVTDREDEGHIQIKSEDMTLDEYKESLKCTQDIKITENPFESVGLKLIKKRKKISKQY